jgi:hypothetical protein
LVVIFVVWVLGRASRLRKVSKQTAVHCERVFELENRVE